MPPSTPKARNTRTRLIVVCTLSSGLAYCTKASGSRHRLGARGRSRTAARAAGRGHELARHDAEVAHVDDAVVDAGPSGAACRADRAPRRRGARPRRRVRRRAAPSSRPGRTAVDSRPGFALELVRRSAGGGAQVVVEAVADALLRDARRSRRRTGSRITKVSAAVTTATLSSHRQARPHASSLST